MLWSCFPWDVIYPHQLCSFLKISALSIDVGNTRIRFLWSKLVKNPCSNNTLEFDAREKQEKENSKSDLFSVGKLRNGTGETFFWMNRKLRNRRELMYVYKILALFVDEYGRIVQPSNSFLYIHYMSVSFIMLG